MDGATSNGGSKLRWQNGGLPVFGHPTYSYPMQSYFALIIALPLHPDPLFANRQTLGEIDLASRSVGIRLPVVVHTRRNSNI